MNLQELLWRSLEFPAVYKDWVRQEAVKMVKFAHKGEKNSGVWGDRRTLPDMLEIAKVKHGHMSLDDLKEYRFSHGHCVASKH
jgi:hypothetical protein